MELREYTEAVIREMKCKKARELVEEEILDHIEDRSLEYQEEGMIEHEAKKKAMEGMGDPKEVGMALDKVHRPRVPYSLIIMILILTGIGVAMQGIAYYSQNAGEASFFSIEKWSMYNLMGIGVMFAVMLVDYRILARKALWLYGIYLGSIIIAGFIPLELHSLFIGRPWMLGYYITVIYGLLYVGILFNFKEYGMKGIVLAFGLSVMAIVLLLVEGLLNIPALVEVFCSCTLVTIFGIERRILIKEKRRIQFWSVFLGAFTLITAAIVLEWKFLGNGYLNYTWNRIKSYFSTEVVRGMEEPFSLFGNLSKSGTKNLSMEYLIKGILNYYGIAGGVLIGILLVAFFYLVFKTIRQQKNTFGLCLGVFIFGGILFRVVLYVAYNFGYSITATTAMPFFSNEIGNILLNGLFLGILLSVHRNTDILPEIRKKKPLVNNKLKAI